MSKLILTAKLQTAAGDPSAKGKGRRVRIVAYSGAVMRVPGWGQCLIELGGLELPATVTLLADHRNELGAVVGSGRPVIEKGQLVIVGTIAGTDAGREVTELLGAGVSLQASVGVEPGITQYVRAGEKVKANGRTHDAPAEGLLLIVKGKLKEVSLTPIGADAETTVSLAARAALQRGVKMDFHEWLKAGGFDPARLPDSQRETLLKAFNAEQATLRASAEGQDELAVLMAPARARTQQRDELRRTIESEARNHPDHGPLVEATARAALAEGWSSDRFRLELLRGCSMRHIDNTPRGGSGPATPETLKCAMLLHVGLTKTAEKEHGAQTCQRAADLRIRSVLDWCERSLEARGIDPPRGRDELIKAAAGPSSYSLPVALSNVAEKALLESYAAPTKSWMSWVRRQPVRNFKENSLIRPLTTRGLKRVAPGGELKHGTVVEDVYTHQADTFGEMIVLDRRDIINDDIGALLAIPRELGLEAARTLADEIYTGLLANTGDFFHANNNNFDDGGDSALSATSLEAAISLFRKQTDLAGRVLDVPPMVLLVPPELEFAAKRLLNSTLVERSQATGDLEPTGNALMNMLKPEIEARLSNASFAGSSTTAWYLFSDPATLPVGIVSFLDGREAPTVEMIDVPSNYLGAGWRVIFDVGFNLADHRAGTKFAGA